LHAAGAPRTDPGRQRSQAGARAFRIVPIMLLQAVRHRLDRSAFNAFSLFHAAKLFHAVKRRKKKVSFSENNLLRLNIPPVLCSPW
jgi:hypothetical protein